jgi:hypothetical protein
MAEALLLLKRLTLSHNDIQELPRDFVERFGEPKEECDLDPTCVVTLAGNPILRRDTAEGASPMEE